MSNKDAVIPLDFESQASQRTVFQITQHCCGAFCGFFKAWIPCVGCFFCCFKHPYITIPQGSKGLLLRYKNYIQTVGPGLIYINSLTQSIIEVDCRITLITIPDQKLMTKGKHAYDSDNIAIKVQSCVYYYIKNPHLANFRINDDAASLSKVCGGMIKNTITAFTFQQLLEKKQSIAQDIQQQLQPIIQHWGIVVDNVCLKSTAVG